MNIRTKITAGDIIITALIVAAAVLLFVLPTVSEGGTYAVIEVRGGETLRYNLDESREIEVESNGITLHIVIGDGGICVSDSDCADRICVLTGRINKSGHSIICAPAGVVIRIEGGGGDEDHIAG